MRHEPAIAFEIDSLHRELEVLAERGKWSEIAELLERRNELLCKAINIDGATIVTAAIHSNNRLLELAKVDRQAVARELTSLRHSRKATGRYEAHREAAKGPSGF